MRSPKDVKIFLMTNTNKIVSVINVNPKREINVSIDWLLLVPRSNTLNTKTTANIGR